MGNMDIEQRVISVFWNKFQFHAERLSETQKIFLHESRFVCFVYGIRKGTAY